jgi:ribonucleoside-diphosphate reductase beta chain
LNTVFNSRNLDTRNQPLFLGESLSLQRFDQLKYPKFFKLAEKQEESFWRANEISLLKDRADHKLLSDNEKFIFDNNLRWQTMVDSMLSRSIDGIAQYVSNPELEAAMKVWSFFESNIHSRSYSHILKNIYSNESDFWNSIIENPEIMKRAEDTRKYYDELFKDDVKDLKTKIFNCIVSTNVVESLSFYISFACSFFFGVQGKMEGNAKIIKLVMKDEAYHVSISTEILKIFRDVEGEGFQEIYDEEKIKEAFITAVNIEKDWADYLFQHGNLLGLTKEQFKNFAEFKSNERLKILGIHSPYHKYPSNPLGNWYDEFTSRKKTQVAPQESELEDYAIGARNTEISEDAFSSFEL